MLPLPNLNDQEIHSVMKTILYRMRQYGAGWEDTDIHDPGITFLELFVAIKAQQQRDIDKIGTRNLEKFLKLLKIEPRKKCCATTKVCLIPKKDTMIPKGTKLLGEDLVFETLETRKIVANEIRFLCSQSDDTKKLYKYDVYDLDRNIMMFEERNAKQQCFYIGFQKKIMSEQFSLFFQLKDAGKRNPVFQRDSFYPLSEIQWEYYGEEQGIFGWHSIEVLKDETYSFLFSGEVTLLVHGDMEQFELEPDKKAFYIRGKLKKYGYEQPPVLSYAMMNQVPCIQKDTLCETIEFTYKEFVTNEMYLWSDLANENQYALYIKKENGFFDAEEFNVVYLLKKMDDGRFRLGTSGRKELLTLFEGFHSEDIVFRLVLYQKEFYQERFLGSSNATVDQEIECFGYEDICYDSFEIMVRSQRGWEIWDKVDTLDCCSGKEKKYIFNEENGALRFGNNQNGKVPSLGEKNICISSLAVTKAENGMVNPLTLNEFFHEEIFPDIEIFHFQSAKNGKSAQSLEDLLRIARKAINETHRAVTLDDYRELAMRTPGLCLGQVTVIPLFRPGMKDYPENKVENTITIVVEPYCMVHNRNVLDGYIKNVKGYMKRYKLLTTRLFVTAPVYIPIDLFGEIRVKHKEVGLEKALEHGVRNYIDKLQEKTLGVTLFYGGIYNVLESLEWVEEIRYLQLDVPMDTVSKNAFGDLKIPPHAKVYLRSNQMILS